MNAVESTTVIDRRTAMRKKEKAVRVNGEEGKKGKKGSKPVNLDGGGGQGGSDPGNKQNDPGRDVTVP